MNWSRSQLDLFRLAARRPEGVEIDIVEVHVGQAGLSRALAHLAARSRREADLPRSILLDGAGAWDAVMSCGEAASTRRQGIGYFDRLNYSLRALSGEGRRPLALWLEEARMMGTRGRELFHAHAEYVAANAGIALRIVYLLGSVMLYDQKLRKRIPGFPPLGNRLLGRATLYQFRREAFEQIEESDVDAAPARRLA